MKTQRRRVTVRFFKPKDMGSRIWGNEILIAHVPGQYTGKILSRRVVPKRTANLQRHRIKNECSYVFSGKVKFYYDDGTGKIKTKILKAGDAVHIPPGAVHAEQTIEDCIIFETSNPVFNDRESMNSKYGWSTPEGALPSTKLDEIELR